MVNAGVSTATKDLAWLNTCAGKLSSLTTPDRPLRLLDKSRVSVELLSLLGNVFESLFDVLPEPRAILLAAVSNRSSSWRDCRGWQSLCCDPTVAVGGQTHFTADVSVDEGLDDRVCHIGRGLGCPVVKCDSDADIVCFVTVLVVVVGSIEIVHKRPCGVVVSDTARLQASVSASPSSVISVSDANTAMCGSATRSLASAASTRT